ncbi:MAG: PAS domain S-box protein [Bacteroidetes bacterium]|nr:PAS domain S-box protein [Bacteroidota bacterium]
MKKTHTNKNIYWGIFILLALILFTTGSLYYHLRKIAYKIETEQRLAQIARIKIDRISQWYTDEVHDATVLSKNHTLNYLFTIYNRTKSKYHYSTLHQYLQNVADEHDYSNILITSQSGSALIALDSSYSNDSALIQTIHTASLTGSATCSDLYRSSDSLSVFIDFVAPFIQKAQDTLFIVFRKNPFNSLYPLIQEWGYPFTSIETILLRHRDTIIEFISEPREHPSSILQTRFSLKESNIVETHAVKKHQGICTGKDYRGIDVIAYTTSVRSTPWYIVVKIDEDEAFNALTAETRNLAIILALLIVTIATGLSFAYSQQQQKILMHAWETHEQFRITLYSIGDAVIITNVTGYVQFINPIAEKLLGWTEQAAQGKKYDELFQLINEETHRPVENIFNLVLTKGTPIKLAPHTILVTKDGREIPVADSAAPIRNKEGAIIGVIFVLRDQTEERNAHRALENAKNFAETIIETLHEPLIVLRHDFTIIAVNKAFCSTFSVTKDTIVGTHFFTLLNGLWNTQPLRIAIETALQKRTKENVRIDLSLPDGVTRILDCHIRPFYRETTHEQLILVSIDDITEQRQAELLVERSEQKLRSIFSVLPDVILVLDKNGRYREILPTNPQLLYRPADDLLGKTLEEVFPSEQASVFMGALATCIRSQKQVTLDYKLTINNRDTWFNATILPYQRDTVLWIARDITDRKRIEQELKESEEWFRRLADTTSTAIVIYQGKRFVYVNKTTCRMLGYSYEELLSMNFWDIVHPDHRDMVRERGFARQRGEKVPERYEMKLIRKDGTTLWIDFTAGKIDWFGAPAGMGTAIDITERKLAEEALYERERTLATLLSNIPGFAYRCANDKDWTMMFISDGCKDITGYEPEDFINNATIAFNDIIHPDYRELLWNLWQQKLPSREIFEYEYPIITKHGELRWVWERGRGVYDAGGTLLFLEGFITDITTRKQAEEALALERNLLRTIINNLPDAIYAKDTSCRKILANTVDVRNIGATSEADVIGKDDFALFPPDIAESFYRDDRYVIETGNPILNREERIRFADGSNGYLLTSKVPLRDSSGKVIGLVGIGHDITQRKIVEDALKQSEARYKEFVDNDLTGDFTATPSGKILTFNQSFLRIFGFKSPAEIQNTSLLSLFTSPERWPQLLSLLHQYKRLEYYEVEMKRVDGGKVYAVLNIVGKVDEHGSLNEIIGYVFDDTRRHELEQQVIQKQKLESIGVLASGIAHDFNNILGIILAYTARLEQTSAQQRISHKDFEIIRKAVERGASLVRQILTFARQTELTMASINVNTVLSEFYQMIFETFPRTIDIQLNLAHNLPTVIADQTQLQQAFLNLAVNAKDAMPQGGSLIFKTGVVDGATLRAKYPTATAEQYVSITIADTGCGIPEEHLKNIFEPFFTTKEKGRGTGLGLAVVYGIVTSHQGFIDVESTVGRGTTFTLYLPASTVIDFESFTHEESTTEIGGSGTILLIEDEDALRDITSSILESAGYTVLVARDADEAFTVFDQNKESIDLILTDLGLPKIDGAELIRRLLQKKPSLLTIVGSGYFEQEKREELKKLNVEVFLQKPYKPQELLNKVQLALGKRRPSQ